MKKLPLYSVAINHCQCHPETCGCRPYVVLTPEGQRYQTFHDREVATEICELLNERLERNRPQVTYLEFKPVYQRFSARLNDTVYAFNVTHDLDGNADASVTKSSFEGKDAGKQFVLAINENKEYYWSHVGSHGLVFGSVYEASRALLSALEKEFNNVEIDTKAIQV